MSEERMKILEMVQEGKISAAEAERLLTALEEADKPGTDVSAKTPRWLRVHIVDKATDKPKVNISVPLALAGLALKLIPASAKEKMAKDGIDLDELVVGVKKNVTPGELVRFDTENESIKVSLE